MAFSQKKNTAGDAAGLKPDVVARIECLKMAVETRSQGMRGEQILERADQFFAYAVSGHVPAPREGGGKPSK